MQIFFYLFWKELSLRQNTRTMNDPEIRELLRSTELSHFIQDPFSRVVEEFSLPVAKARIDIAVVNGALHGYEIKSASDNLKRLPSQIEAYTKVFDFISVVTEKRYLNHIVNEFPKWIGVIECDESSNSVKQIRRPKQNKLREGFFIAKLLWRDELIDCLKELNIPFRNRNGHWILCETLSENTTVDQLSEIVRSKLKSRSAWKDEEVTECCI